MATPRYLPGAWTKYIDLLNAGRARLTHDDPPRIVLLGESKPRPVPDIIPTDLVGL
jgi:hypothetical protein